MTCSASYPGCELESIWSHGAEYVKKYAKKIDADETAEQEDKEGSGSDGFLSSSDDEDDLPANGRMT